MQESAKNDQLRHDNYGMRQLSDQGPIPNSQTWLFGWNC